MGNDKTESLRSGAPGVDWAALYALVAEALALVASANLAAEDAIRTLQVLENRIRESELTA